MQLHLRHPLASERDRPPSLLRKLLMDKLDKTQIGALLREFGLVTGG
jgi:hypothetical protein